MKAMIFAAAAAAVLVSGVSATAAERPRRAMDDFKSISDSDAYEAVQALHDERHRDLVHHVFTPSDTAPWDGGIAACAQPRNQYLMAFGEFMVRHTQRNPTDRFAPRDLRSIEVINSRLRLDITEMTKRLPPEGRAQFLEPGETLADDPKSWDHAARVRAEWSVALDGVLAGLDAKAHHNLDEGSNYVAGLWTRMACDFQAQNAGFLRRYDANGAAPGDDRTRAALELLRRRAGH